MSRPPSKRRRFSPPLDDLFASSTSAHIFASSSEPLSAKDSLLRPCSYEITLHRDDELKISLQPRPSTEDGAAGSGQGMRLVKWTCSSSGKTVTTDRYDAIHLLNELPSRSPTGKTQSGGGEKDDIGWSDLDSDTEDLFYMTDAEASAFTHNKARSRLQDQHAARLAALSSTDEPTPPSLTVEAEQSPKEAAEELSRSQFDLMAKTAKVLAGSTNASMLELKILANHGGDPRFAFLQTQSKHPPWSAVWTELKMRRGVMTFEEALGLLQPQPRTEDEPQKAQQLGLVAYDDSDTDDEIDAEPVNEKETEEQEKKRKQAERLARAKEWLKTRPKKPHPASESTQP